MRRLMTVALTLSAALAAAAAPGPATAGGTVTAGSGGSITGVSTMAAVTMVGVTIRNRNSGSCVNGPGADGGVVMQVGCGIAWGNRTWNVTPVMNRPGLFEITNTVTGRCLEIAGWSTADGAAAVTFGCHHGTNQRWWVTRRGDGYYEIRNESGGRCLDARTTRDWIGLYQWGCHGGGEQQWAIY
ncbi:MAG TPA: RICIN domain-containing protein [Actinoplanes sp.]|jgi:hypothetical protein